MPSLVGIAFNSCCSWQYTSIEEDVCCSCCRGNRMWSEGCEIHVRVKLHCPLHGDCLECARSRPTSPTQFRQPVTANNRQRRLLSATAESAALSVNTLSPDLLSAIAHLRKAADEFDKKHKKSNWLPLTAVAVAIAALVLL